MKVVAGPDRTAVEQNMGDGTMKTIFDRSVFLLNGAALALCGLALVDFFLHPLAGDFIYHSTVFRAVTILVFTPFTLLVGFLIIRRVPGNIVGPLLILWSATVAYGSVRQDIGPVPFVLFALYEIIIGWFALILIVVHFPNGRIYPPAAAPWIYRLIWTIVPLAMLIFLSSAHNQGGAANPFLIPALQKYNDLFTWLGFLVLSPVLLLAMVSPVLRYRAGSLVERQQIKWLGLFGVALVTWTILGLMVYPALTGGEMMSREDSLSSLIFTTFTELFPPLAIGIAVLRYHLWDIDVIIRRTLVYSILTVFLTAVYFGSVVLLQELVQLITGNQESPVATVLSTLAIVVLFIPVRRYIQERVNRRFYRQKYNAEKVLGGFSAVLRDEVELIHLTDSIQAVVKETMQPAHVSLWLRGINHQQDQLHRSEENSLH